MMLTILYLHFSDSVEGMVTAFCLGFSTFSIGHLFARGFRLGTRAAAAIASVAMMFATIAVLGKMTISTAGLHGLLGFAFVSLTVFCIVLASELASPAPLSFSEYLDD